MRISVYIIISLITLRISKFAHAFCQKARILQHFNTHRPTPIVRLLSKANVQNGLQRPHLQQ